MKLQIISVIFLFTFISCASKTGKTSSKETQEYKADWESLQNYEAPEWYEDAKLGFWVHWGVYSVPAFKGDHAAEWYGRRMYQKNGQSEFNKGYAQHQHHVENYGDPSEFGYKDFIPKFQAEHFNADEWADLCVEGGAKFFTMMGVHHDAFCLWDTKLTQWNSVNMGPQRDLVGEIEKAVRKKGLKFGVSNHSAWNYMFFQWNHINGYDAADPANQDLYGNPIYPQEMVNVQCAEGESKKEWRAKGRDDVHPSKRDLDRWLERTKELADLYKPDLYYFDWGFRVPEFEKGRKEFGAHYYNKAIEWGLGEFGKPEVVLNYKGRSYAKGSAVLDFERGGKDEIADMVWQTDDCVYDNHNWGFVPNSPIKPTNVIVDELVDIVSKRGVLMLSFAPKADGTFPEEQKVMIRELGSWLNICGEAIYATRPYTTMGERSAGWGVRDAHNIKNYVGTKEDIRFTRNKENNVLYATVLDWPGDKLLIKTSAKADLSGIQSVTLLGSDKELDWMQSEHGLMISLPQKPDYKFAYPVRIEFKDKVASYQ